MPRIKICGNTNLADAKLAQELGADYLGFIFTESKRKVEVEVVKEIMKALQRFSNFVGVFANQPKQEVEGIAKELALKTLQFHGDETSRYCRYFMEKGYEVIKTFRIKDAMSLKRIDDYDVTSFLFDAYSKEDLGGTGTAFDWSLIGNRPFVHEKLFLAGGLNAENVQKAIGMIHPYAVDVASGVESEQGKKDPVKLKTFIEKVKEGKVSDAEKGSLHS